MTCDFSYLFLFISYTRLLQSDLLKNFIELAARPYFQHSGPPLSHPVCTTGGPRLSEFGGLLTAFVSVHFGPGKVYLAFNPNYIFSFYISFVIFMSLQQDGFIKEHDPEDLSPVKSHKAGHSPLRGREPYLPLLLLPSLPFYSLFFFNTYCVTILQVRRLKLRTGDWPRPFR